MVAESGEKEGIDAIADSFLKLGFLCEISGNYYTALCNYSSAEQLNESELARRAAERASNMVLTYGGMAEQQGRFENALLQYQFVHRVRPTYITSSALSRVEKKIVEAGQAAKESPKPTSFMDLAGCNGGEQNVSEK